MSRHDYTCHKYKLIWNTIKADDSIDLIEHPLLSTLIPKDEFESEFNLFLGELDGTTASDYFDFYFEKCCINTNTYRFRDDDSKEDFIEACIELNIIPSMKEILRGEMKEDVEKRKGKTSKELCDSFVQLKTKEMSKKYHSDNVEKSHKSKIQQLKDTFDSLLKKIAIEQNEEKKIKYQKKLDKVISMMEHSY